MRTSKISARKLSAGKASGGLLVAAVLLLTSCRHAAKPISAESLKPISSPAGPDSAQPNLAVGPDGAVYLSWIETTDSGSPALKFAALKDGKWSPAQTIAEGDQLLVNYADFPSLLPLGGGLLAAHWMTLIPHSDEGYNINIAFSRDDGRTWSKPVVPHRDGTPTEHGFVSLTSASTPGSGGGVGAIWLDSRKLAVPKGPDDVAMIYSSVGADGTLGPEMTVDGRVCECCHPEAVRTANGILAVYRGRSAEEVRDIAIVRFDGTKWSEPKTVFADHWKINACPINGPAIAAHENEIAVAWFTAPDNKPKVQVAFSSDGGNTFGPPVRVDDGNPVGRVGVVALDSGSAVVSWLERGAKQSVLRARQIDKDGTSYPAFDVASADSGTSSGFPRIVRNGDSIIFAWTDSDAGGVRVSMLDLKK